MLRDRSLVLLAKQRRREDRASEIRGSWRNVFPELIQSQSQSQTQSQSPDLNLNNPNVDRIQIWIQISLSLSVLFQPLSNSQ